MGLNKKKARGAKARRPEAKVDPMELVLQAQEVIAVGDIEQAQTLMAKALAAAPNDPHVLTAFGSMLAEVGNTDKAILTLKKAIRIAPDSGFEKFMYLSQLLGHTDEAEAACCAGIEILKSDVQDLDEAGCAEDAQELRGNLCSALCSLAELRLERAAALTDVEGDCESLLQQANELAPESPEPLQALASLRYEQGRMGDALQVLRQSLSKWWKPENGDAGGDADGGDEGVGGQGGVNDEDMDDDAEVQDSTPGPKPSYEFRFETAKLLIELDETTDAAVQVLEDLLDEYDESPDTWHLLSLAYYGGGMFEEARETLEFGYKLLKKLDVAKDSEVAFMYDELKERIEEAEQQRPQQAM